MPPRRLPEQPLTPALPPSSLQLVTVSSGSGEVGEKRSTPIMKAASTGWGLEGVGWVCMEGLPSLHPTSWQLQIEAAEWHGLVRTAAGKGSGVYVLMYHCLARAAVVERPQSPSPTIALARVLWMGRRWSPSPTAPPTTGALAGTETPLSPSPCQAAGGAGIGGCHCLGWQRLHSKLTLDVVWPDVR